jgi:tripartite-type tricarboxylate transporter receptor subunit TctC
MRFGPWLLAAMSLTAAWPGGARAQDAVANFYRGKQIDLVVGTTAGGGYDTYARLIARHFSAHMPGSPTLVPQNMPGAGSNKAAAYIYNVAKKDGTAIGAVFSGAMMEPLLGDKTSVQHDPAKLIYLGSANNEVFFCFTWGSSPVKTYQDALIKTAILAASAEGGSTKDFPSLENNLIGTKFKIVAGYPGSREMIHAVEQGEADGQCGYGWSSLMGSQPQWYSEKKINFLAQEAVKGHPILNAMGVPLVTDFAKNAADRQAIELVFGQLMFGRPYILPPGVPAERVAALRKAFLDTLADKDLLAEAEKSRLDIDPVSGEEVQRLVAKMYATPAEIVEHARQSLVFKGDK